MSIATQVSGLATRIGTEFKAVRVSQGVLTTLTTTAKGSLVAAINEVDAAVASAAGINDGAVSGSSTYSSTKITTDFAPKANPTFTGTVSGVTKAMVGLSSVDNTTDAGKPVSTAQQTALNLKANIASPTFTGTVSGITAAMVGLSAVNNTADSAKPVSTAQAAAILALIDDVATTGTTKTWSISQIKVAIANVVNSAPAALDTLSELATALGSDANFAATTATSLGNRLRIDASQTLTAPQKAFGIANLGAATAVDLGDPATDFVGVFEAALV